MSKKNRILTPRPPIFDTNRVFLTPYKKTYPYLCTVEKRDNELISKLKEENKKLNKIISELNLKLEELINKNNDLV
jgi:hypothetical protein